MSKVLSFMRRERLSILLLIFVVIMTAVILMPQERGEKARPAQPKQTHADQLKQQAQVEELISKDRSLAFVLGMASLLFILVVLLGIIVDTMLIGSRLKGKRLSISTYVPATVQWGIWDVCRVAILFLFFGYCLLLIEAFLSRVFPVVKDDNFRMILNSSILDSVTVILVLYYTVGQYREKLVALGLTLRNFSKNVFYGVVGYVAVVPVLVGILVVIAFLLGIFKYVPEKQAVVELFLKEKSTPLLVYTSLFAAIAGPIIEELFFRGFMYNACRKHVGIFWATLISAATFAGLHAHAVGFFPILALGVVLAYLYEKTGSLVSSITVHMIHNLSMVGMVFLVKQMGVY